MGQCFPKELLLVHHNLLRFNLNGQHGLGKKYKQDPETFAVMDATDGH